MYLPLLMHYVYLLESGQDSKHWYVGCTNNLQRRLKEHNEGDTFHTKKYAPWKIRTYHAFSDIEKAIAFEKYLKSHAGRAFSNSHF
jgi:predicted GIY-YIG superfamily endonuclease